MNKYKRNKIKGEFASIFEKEVFEDAKARGIEISYEPRTFDYKKRSPRGCKCGDCGSTRILVPGRYTPDFFIDGRIYVEAKGFFKAEKRSLMEDFIKCNQSLPFGERIDLRFLFAQDNWMTKSKKNRYSDWARKNGVKFYVGKKIPDSWLAKGNESRDSGHTEPNKLGSDGDPIKAQPTVHSAPSRGRKRGRGKQKPSGDGDTGGA